MTDQIDEIDKQHWNELRELYSKDWPRNMVGFYTINNYIKWMEREPYTKKLNFYCLNNDWSDGTFVVIDRYQLFVNTISSSHERLAKLLQLLDWSHGFRVSTLIGRLRLPVMDAIKSKNLSLEYDCKSLLYYMSRDQAAQMEVNLPKGYKLKSLCESEAEHVDRKWPNREVGSTFLIKRLVRLNPNVGIFTNDKKMVAWSLRMQGGPLGALQVDDEYRGQGFGVLVCKAITAIIGKMGEDVFASVDDDNIPSRKTFERCGFIVLDDTYTIRTKATMPFVWTDDD